MGRFLAVVALVALLACAWWLARGKERGDTASGTREELAAPGAATLVAPQNAGEWATFAAPSAPGASIPRSVAERAPAAADEAAASDELRVRVVDATGTPLANVPISLVPPHDPASGGATEKVQQPTDAQGRARFAKVRARIASAPQPWILSHDLPAAQPPSRLLDHAALESDELVSVLPPGGVLDVRVRELDGTPAPRGSELRLRLVQPVALGEPQEARSWNLDLVADRARFPWVELGRTWELAAWRPQGAVPARARVAGPARPGETVSVELVLGADNAVVSFRAVDGAGRPFASVALELVRRQAFGTVQRTPLFTDARGRFLVDGERSLFDAATFVVSHLPDDGSLLQGRATLPDTPLVGWNDGGDVVLAPQPLLCAGRVVDPLGHGSAGADVVAGEDCGWLGGCAQVRRKTDMDGRFELRGLWDTDEFDLRAEQGGMRSETIHAHQGDDGLVLPLVPRHSLSGCLDVDEGIDASAVRFQLLPIEGEPFDVDRRRIHFAGLTFAEGAVFRNPVEPDPRCFQLEPVPGGTYELRCLLEGAELARTRPFALHGDLDLGTLELRGRIKSCEIVLRGAADPAALRGKAIWSASNSPVTHEFEFEGDRVRIQAPTLPIDVVLLPRGYRLEHLKGIRERSEVELEPTLRVRIVLATDGELPAAPFVFGCDLYQDGLSIGDAQGVASFDAENREIAFRCSAPGRIQVRWRLERAFEGASFGGAIGGGVLDGHEVEIQVRDEVAEQVFTVPLDGALLAKLMQAPPW